MTRLRRWVFRLLTALLGAGSVVVVLTAWAPAGIASPTAANKPFIVYQGLAAAPTVPTPIVVVQPYNGEFTTAKIRALHAKSATAKIIRYVDTTEIIDTVSALSDPRPWSLAYARRLNSDGEWRDVWTNHQSWFLRDAQGNYITRPASNNFEMNPKRAYLMDQGSAGWRTWLTYKVYERLSHGYDGVFLDLCSPTPTGYSAIPAKYANDYSKWRADVNGLIDFLHARYPKALIITNSIWQGQKFYANDYPNPIDDNHQNGIEIEGFMYGKGTGPTLSEANWLKEVKIVKRLGDQGKIVLARTTLSSTNSASPKRLLAYSLGTFLLGKSNSKAYFNFISWKGESGYSATYLKAVYALQLGDPVGAYYQRGVAYRRDFTNGKVMVNPNDAKQNYTFLPTAPNRYKDQDGHVYDATHPLTLAAKSGVILIALPVPPPAGATRYQQSDGRIAKTGSWETFTRAEASGGDYGRSASTGASATITFTGTKVSIVAMKGTTTGIVDVYLDGVRKTTIDTADDEPSYQLVLWTSGTLTKGTHKVKLVRSDSSAAGKFLTLDAVDIWGTLN